MAQKLENRSSSTPSLPGCKPALLSQAFEYGSFRNIFDDFFNEEKYEDAASICRRTLSEQNLTVNQQCLVLLDSGDVLKELGKYRDAQKSYDQALALDGLPVHLEVRCLQRLAKLLIHMEGEGLNSSSPEPYLQRAIKLQPTDDENYLLMSQKLLYDDKPEEAKDYLVKILTMDTKNAEAHYQLGVIYGFYLNDDEKATRHFQYAIKNNKLRSSYYYNFGSLHIKCERWVEAKRQLSKAVDLNQNNLDYRAQYAWVISTLHFKETIKSKKILLGILEKDQSHSNANLYLALIYAHIERDFNKAYQLFQQIFGVDPDNDTAHFFFGLMLKYCLNRTHEGEKHMEIARNCKSPAWFGCSYYEQACHLIQRQFFEEGQEVLEHALTIKPDHSYSIELLQQVKSHVKKSRSRKKSSKRSIWGRR